MICTRCWTRYQTDQCETVPCKLYRANNRVCPGCGGVFSRERGESLTNWSLRQHCSHRCRRDDIGTRVCEECYSTYQITKAERWAAFKERRFCCRDCMEAFTNRINRVEESLARYQRARARWTKLRNANDPRLAASIAAKLEIVVRRRFEWLRARQELLDKIDDVARHGRY